MRDSCVNARVTGLCAFVAERYNSQQIITIFLGDHQRTPWIALENAPLFFLFDWLLQYCLLGKHLSLLERIQRRELPDRRRLTGSFCTRFCNSLVRLLVFGLLEVLDCSDHLNTEKVIPYSGWIVGNVLLKEVAPHPATKGRKLT